MAQIVLDGITKRYGDGFEAVKNLNLEIGDGEFMILVGPSGCGKSTALRMIAGLEDISEGELRIGDEVVNNLSPKERDISMVFQNYALYPHMTVRENMEFPLRLAKVDPDKIRVKIEEAAKILDLTEHLDRKPANLSGGQRQRVAMGRAIVRDPKAFLMDEPLSNLDAKLRVQMRTEVARLQSQLGTTTVYVTHDQVEAMTLGDRVAVMRRGVLQQVGPPGELYAHPVNLFVAGFIGSPAMNFMPGELDESGQSVRTPIAELPIPEDLRKNLGSGHGGQRVIVGIRPENFEDASVVDDSIKGRGATFTAQIELVESMGSEQYVYFKLGEDTLASREMEALGKAEHDAGASDLEADIDTSQAVARLDPTSQAKRGEELELWADALKIQLFDPESGDSLLWKPEGGADDGAAPEAQIAEGTDTTSA